jgi:hypothetical protein
VVLAAHPSAWPGISRPLRPSFKKRRLCLLSEAERAVLDTALERYKGKPDPILVGGNRLLKPALRLMSMYRLKINEVADGEAVTIFYLLD